MSSILLSRWSGSACRTSTGGWAVMVASAAGRAAQMGGSRCLRATYAAKAAAPDAAPAAAKRRGRPRSSEASGAKAAPPAPASPPMQAPLQADAQFLARGAQRHEDLGLSPLMSDALRRAGFAAPSRTQELAVPLMVEGRDVVLAAETGSGKTLAYLAPLADYLLQAAGEMPEEGRDRVKPLALVLCPNVPLCQQVLGVLASLRDEAGAPLLRGAHVSTSSPPPFDVPDVVVSTPAGLMALLNTPGQHYGRLWTQEGLAARVAALVVDEADLLVTGAYAKDLTRILDLFKVGERRRVEALVAQELGLEPEDVARLPRLQRAACWEGGVPAMLRAGYRLPAGADAAGPGGDGFGPYPKRQYAFVAATMPALTKGDVGTELAARYRGVTWVSGDLLHRSKPGLAHGWVRTEDPRAWEGALVAAILEDPDYLANRARVLVFARDTASADRVSDLLQREVIAHSLYHKGVPAERRAAALAAMAAAVAGEAGGGNAVMVSTDAASRGIDLPDVTHVIQADFATAAIDFLHRIGRTARAGREGKVTSLIAPEHETLAAVLQEYVEAGRPVEDCFSRNRSFGRKVKRFGKFVPRGERGGGGSGAPPA